MFHVKLFQQTSEAVSIGHPDKTADSIADAILDYIRSVNSDAHSAVEIACGAKKIMVFGEVDARVDVPRGTIEKIVRRRLDEIGYTQAEYDPQIIFDLVQQSSEINAAVTSSADTGETGAGDQGIMFGYAIRETPELHSLHFVLAHLLQKKLEEARKSGAMEFLRPDAKTQVTVEYEYTEQGINRPVAVRDVVLSTQHSKTDFSEMQEVLKEFVIQTINQYLEEMFHGEHFPHQIEKLTNTTPIHINPAGPWHNGGPAFDSGLTGRKLVVDNYGGNAPIGGGSYSGKDLTKVDRSAAYYARYVAKSAVAAGLADKIQVALAYAIGVSHPTMVSIDTFGTGKLKDAQLLEILQRNFDFRVDSIIAHTSKLTNFVETGEHSHYLQSESFQHYAFPWEEVKVIEG